MLRRPIVTASLLPPLLGLLLLGETSPVWAEPPCDKYVTDRQPTCARLWKQLNREAEAEISRFGLDQLRRREAGQISQEQHLKENIEFIRQSTAKRLKLLDERMAQDAGHAPAPPSQR